MKSGKTKKSYRNIDNLVKNVILGVKVTNESQKEILEFLVKSIERSFGSYYIVTPNPEILVHASHHQNFKNILNQAQISLCDGVGLILAGKILGKPFVQRVTGVDFMKNLCEAVSEKPITVGFLGGRDRVAELTSKCLRQKYPDLKVSFVGEEWEDEEKISTSKFKQRIDILFVAFGFSKQEEWMAQHVGKIPVRVMIGVGGAFDYISGKAPRAPLFIRRIGFEWFYRLIHQPWRFKRQLALLEFFFLILKEKFEADTGF